MALDRLEIDELGLDSNDRRMLEMIIKGYSGGPVGLETLASALGEETVTLEDVCEPYLMQLGFLARTPLGTLCYCIGVSASGLSAAGFRRRYGRSDANFPQKNLKATLYKACLTALRAIAVLCGVASKNIKIIDEKTSE